MRSRSNCRPTAVLITQYLVIFFHLISTCHANSSSSIDGPGLVQSQGKDIIGSFGENDAIQSVISQVSSWMKEKQKNVKRKLGIEEDIITLPQDQQPQMHELMDRPFVTLAYAQTLDGMIAATSPNDGETSTSNLKLSSPESFLLTHHLRNIHDAILVGGSTFLLDQPRLNVRLPKESTTNGVIEDPMPIVLDTHLNNLQLLLFEKIVLEASSSKEETLPDITIDKIRVHNPVICCSSNAARSFLDTLEIFQDQQITKKKKKRTYKISVFKMIDDYDDTYMPIKITIQITHHSKKKEEDTVQDVMLTLLPCEIKEEQTEASKIQLNLRHVLHQLYNQFGTESIMVEGGAGILSSFMNECVGGDGVSSESGSVDKLVDCMCVTIAPKIMGGKWGLPVLGGLNVLQVDCGDDNNSSSKGSDSDEGEDASINALPGMMMAIREGRFVSLGPDCNFLGRV